MIKFIRHYKFYGSDWFDIIYTDGKYITRVRTCLADDLPKTAQEYIKNAVATEVLKTRYESEYIYERSEGK